MSATECSLKIIYFIPLEVLRFSSEQALRGLVSHSRFDINSQVHYDSIVLSYD